MYDQCCRKRTPIVEAAAEIYRRNLGNAPSLQYICRFLGTNHNKLNSAFKAYFGKTPGEFAKDARLLWVKEQLQLDYWSVHSVANMTGYKSASAFARAYTAYHGEAPSQTMQRHVFEVKGTN